MRNIIATIIMLAVAGQAHALCFSPVQSDAIDAIKYLACVIDEQNSKIEDLTDKVDGLTTKISDLEYEISKRN